MPPLRTPPRNGLLLFDTRILAEADLSATVIRDAKRGETLRVVGSDSGFAMIEVDGDQTGYVGQLAVGENLSAPWESTAPQEIVEYTSQAEFEFSRQGWMENGWRIASVTQVPQRAGAARIFALGLLSLAAKSEAHVLVVFERASVMSTPESEDATRSGTQSSLSTELERLAALHERGILDDGEFARAKHALLGRD